MEFQKIANFLVATSDDRFVTKKLIKVYDQSEKNYSPNKEIRIKKSMLRSDLCDFMMSLLLWKEILLLKVIMMLIKEIKILHLKTMHCLLIAFQKIMT